MSNITIDVKNDAMLGRINDGVIAVKLYSLEKQLEEKDKEIERLNSIIKEVREYIEEWQRFPHTNGSIHRELKNLIEILDKEKE